MCYTRERERRGGDRSFLCLKGYIVIVTFSELLAQVREYRPPGRSKLKKKDLQKALAEPRDPSWRKRIWQALETKKFNLNVDFISICSEDSFYKGSVSRPSN